MLNVLRYYNRDKLLQQVTRLKVKNYKHSYYIPFYKLNFYLAKNH